MTEDKKRAKMLRRLGLHIRSLRVMEGLTQGELADCMGKTIEYVIDLELGLFEPTIIEYAEIVKALGKTLDDFVW